MFNISFVPGESITYTYVTHENELLLVFVSTRPPVLRGFLFSITLKHASWLSPFNYNHSFCFLFQEQGK